MQVNYHPPSELDAHVEADGTKLGIRPVFYEVKGSAAVGTFQVVDKQGKVLDRAVVLVSGNGKISVKHRNEEVVPIADTDNGDSKDGGSTKSSTTRTRTTADAHTSPPD